MQHDEFRTGSAAHALELASCMRDEVELGPTDCALCAAALRYMARRWRRWAASALAVIAVVSTVAFVGIADRNGDGRVDLADVWLGMRASVGAVPAAFCASPGGRHA